MFSYHCIVGCQILTKEVYPKQDEWVISRVFQKGGSGGGGSVGTKKTRLITSAASINLYPEPSSPTSVSLPPLLDSSPYPTATATAASSVNLLEHDGCSYGSPITREHVSCFSTIAAAAASADATNFNPSFDLAPPRPSISSVDAFARFPRNIGVSAFPSLRSLQENLQVPFFLSPGSALPLVGGSAELGFCSSASTWPMDPKVDSSDRGPAGGGRMGVGPTELDYMWTY